MFVKRFMTFVTSFLFKQKGSSSIPTALNAAEIFKSNLSREYGAMEQLQQQSQSGSIQELGNTDAIGKVFSGFRDFSKTGQTPNESFMAMRQLHMQTKGQFQKRFINAIKPVFPVVHEPKAIKSKVFGIFDGSTVENIAATIADFGICILPKKIPASMITNIRAGLQGLPTTDDHGNAAGDFPHVGSTIRAFIQEKDLLQIKEVRELALDPLLVQIARAHFGIEPIFESAIAFYTQPHTGGAAALSAAAQMYHIDCDYVNFLKIFIYLSDVTDKEGPHWFVQKSHVKRPDNYWEDRRFSDSEIEAVYPKEDIRCIVGQSGTLFVANTIAFHKGSTPIANPRLLLQFTYCSTLFGTTYNAHLDNPFEFDLIAKSGASPVKSRLLSRFAGMN